MVAVLKRSQEGFALSKERLLLNLGGKKSHNCLCQLGPGAGDVNLRDSQYSAAKRLLHREGKLDQLEARQCIFSFVKSSGVYIGLFQTQQAANVSLWSNAANIY